MSSVQNVSGVIENLSDGRDVPFFSRAILLYELDPHSIFSTGDPLHTVGLRAVSSKGTSAGRSIPICSRVGSGTITKVTMLRLPRDLREWL